MTFGSLWHHLVGWQTLKKRQNFLLEGHPRGGDGRKECIPYTGWKSVCLIGGVPHPLKSCSCGAVFLQALTAGTRNVRTPPYCGGPFTWDDVAWCSNCRLQMLNTTHFSHSLLCHTLSKEELNSIICSKSVWDHQVFGIMWRSIEN